MAFRFALATVFIVQEVGWTHSQTWQGGQRRKFNSATKQIINKNRTAVLKWKSPLFPIQSKPQLSVTSCLYICSAARDKILNHYSSPTCRLRAISTISAIYINAIFSNSSTKFLSPEKKKTHHAPIQHQTHRYIIIIIIIIMFVKG